MVADTNTPAETVAKADEAEANPIAEVTKEVAKTGASAAKAARKPAAKTVRKAKARRKPAVRSKPQPARKQRKTNDMMKFDPTNIFAGFGAFPGATAFEKIFAEASERGELAVKKSRKAAEEFADLYRGNIEAFVEAGKIAASGAQSIGQDFVAKSRDGFEQAASTVRSFTEAKNPTELLQLQSDFARSAFDRFVEDSSALTESVVKLAGEAIQPISNRASSNVEKLNELAA